MDFFVRILTWCTAAAGLVLAMTATAAGQTRRADPPPAPDILTRADFHLSASVLGSGDDRFSWDTHWGGEFDFVDFVKGRVTFYGDYQAVLGNELQPFDPNQGNYTLTVSSSWRLPEAEAAVVFNHVSRHLGDRPKNFGIAWNVLAARWLQDLSVGDTEIALRADLGPVVQNAYVDYTWFAGADVKAVQRVNDRVEAYVRLNGELYGVDPDIAGRTTQRSGGLEGGFRVEGRGGVLELFFGYARVADADPIDRQAERWALAGFRLLSR